MKELEKAYEAKNYEDEIYKRWEESGLFNPDVCVKQGVTAPDASTFTIVLPPPNVTGTLHMGHAAMLAIEDVMIRYARMSGKKTLWLPGTDHAAVATESKVEGILMKEEGMKKPKEEMGREAFLERVKKFAQESHDTIVNQSKKMGASLDWSREAYTLDEKRNLAVRTVFKKMYDDGLIYRGYRVVNWSVKGQSTCSDDELVYVERPAKLYTFKYSKDFPFAIATTRPETKVGDTAVAVHPEGQWKEYIGKEYVVENVGQSGHTLKIKIIADSGVDDSFGTGALGVTPAHSPTDFEMYLAQKSAGNDIGLIQVIGEDGKMTANAGSEYVGLTVEAAREKFVQYLRDNNLLEKEEDTMQNAGTSDRFKDVVEPLPKTQWFIDVNKKFILPVSHIDGVAHGAEVSLKELMQKVVQNKQIEILPDRFEKTYFHWIDNLRDWCISRQIWFGHQIPVWYKDTEMYVGVQAPAGEGWVQDPDTLDTWFSSGLWTFSTLGWPEETRDFQTFHPTSVLETGYDILFFWVARMILMTTYTLGTVPFKQVYLHGLVRDEQGRKMSKSLGNIIDPLDMIEKYGTDATRLSLLLGSTPGNDMKLSEEKIAGFRNFTNKLWNISRFMLLHIENPQQEIAYPAETTLADAWILHRLERVKYEVTENLQKHQFSGAGEKLRDFTWGELADWYLEISKVEGNKSVVLNYILNNLLKLWHPFMPFVTETIWQQIYGAQSILMVQKWPETPKGFDLYYVQNGILDLAEKEFELFQKMITHIRNLRSEYKIEPAQKVTLYTKSGKHGKFLGFEWWNGTQPQMFVESNKKAIEVLARVGEIKIDDEIPKAAVNFVIGKMEMWIDLASALNKEKEISRLEKEIATVEPYVASLKNKLAGDFSKSAPAPIVEKEKQKLVEAEEKLKNLQQELSKWQ